jgi:hypothetical protein
MNKIPITLLLTGTLVVLITLFSAAPAQGFYYVLGTGVYEKPSLSKPAKGETITDPNFNINITRISDDSIDGYSDGAMVFQYDTVPVENSDGTKLLLRGIGTTWHIYDANTFEWEQEIRVREDGDWGQGEIEPMWDADDPDTFYYVMDRGVNKYGESNYAALYRYNISLPWNHVNNREVVHDFRNEYPWAISVDNMDKGTPSADGRYWAFRVNSEVNYYQYAVCYDLDTDTIVSELDEASPNTHIRWISMSTSGKYIVIMYDALPTGYGVFVYNRADFSPITHGDGKNYKRGASAHGDIAVGPTGHDGWFGQNEAQDFIMWWDFETNTALNLIKIPAPCCLGMHFSGNSYEKPGWGVVSTYDPHGVWMDEQIMMFELKEDGKVWRLAHHQSNYAGGYWNQGHSTINRAGTKVYFHSSWGASDQDDNEVYQLELPSTWYEDLAVTQSCSDQSGHYCTDRDTQVCPGQWLYANDTDACCSQPCQLDTEPPLLSVSHSPQNPSESQQVTLTATASDNVKLREVKLYLDGQLARTCSSSPCQNLSGPYPFGTHTYYATAEDYAGNPSRDPPSGTKPFTVTEDTFPPSILNPLASPGSTTATITWETDESATSRVDYGLITSYGQSEEDSTPKTDHSIQLTSLEMEETYYFMITSSDWKGNSNSTTGQFTTIFESQIAALTAQDQDNTITVTSSTPSVGKFRLVFERDTYAGIKEWYDLVNDPMGNENLAGWQGLTGRLAGSPNTMDLFEYTGTRIGINLTASLSDYDRTFTYFVYPSGDLYVKRIEHAKPGAYTHSVQVECIFLSMNSADWTWMSDNDGTVYDNGDYWLSVNKAAKGSILDSVYHADSQLHYDFKNGGEGYYYCGFRVWHSSWSPPDTSEITHSIKIRPDGFSSEAENDEYTGEYRSPATLTFTKGSGGTYNPSEGCYEIAAQSGEAEFTLNPGSYTRRNPAFKLSGWTGNSPATITVSGQTKTRGVDYNADKLDSSTLILQYFGELATPTQFRIGGAEYHPADTDQDGCIVMGELIAFIDKWKMDSTNYPMPELMEAIGLWKQGTGCG